MIAKRSAPDLDAALGLKIAHARRSWRLSQTALAKAASIDRTALSKIETGRRGVSSGELARIADSLGMSLDWFFSKSGGKEDTDLLQRIRSRRKTILKICNKHGAHSPRVFGSAARGDAGPESDIDFLIEMEHGRSLLDQAALLVELRELLGRDVDVVTVVALRERIRDRVMNEAVPL